MSRAYNDPAGGTPSGVGAQFRTDYYAKKALIEAKKETYFGQMADTISMPKHYGKTIKKYHYMPLLDDANVNDQGIDAAGLSVNQSVTITQVDGDGATMYFVGEGVDAAAALTAAQAKAVVYWDDIGVYLTSYAVTKAQQEALDPAWVITEGAAVPESGNLYGSSKDVGTINGKMPLLSENGGRVNRVGFTRIQIEGSIEKFGFFDEYTQESLDFDTDAELDMHINREMVMGANEITEDALQIDLLSSAGVVRYGGAATSTAEVTGLGATIDLVSVPSYEDLMRLSIDLDDNRCPKNTKLISGTRMVDTKTVYAARYMYIGSELVPSIRRMKDLHDNQAFIPVQQYAAAGMTATGEIGSVDQFRIIVVPEMMHWEGAGAAEGANDGSGGPYRTDGANYNVYPMLVVGSESFTTIGFQTSGKTVKFKITHKKPGKETADRTDPYGETGFMSIKWYYGFLLQRPERLAVVKVVAEL